VEHEIERQQTERTKLSQFDGTEVLRQRRAVKLNAGVEVTRRKGCVGGRMPLRGEIGDIDRGRHNTVRKRETFGRWSNGNPALELPGKADRTGRMVRKVHPNQGDGTS
jgi:hypothetical protein